MIRRHSGHDIADIRFPIAHADVNRRPQLAREQVPLLQGQLGQRRASDQTVTMLHFFDNGSRHRAATGDLPQEFRDILDAIRAAMGKKKDG